MSYEFIINPLTGRKVSINSNTGKKIFKQLYESTWG